MKFRLNDFGLLPWVLFSVFLNAPVIAQQQNDSEPPLEKGGAACVMAKWQGNTLDYALVTDRADAQDAAKNILKEKGYDNYERNIDIIHAQEKTALRHAYFMVIKSDFKTIRDKDRTSYGCGFSAKSLRDAEWGAVRDLQSHSWGWTPDQHGYELVEKGSY